MMGSKMSRMRAKAAMGLAIVGLGLGLLACSDATKVNSNPAQVPIQVLRAELAELPKRAAAQAGPPPTVFCDVDEPPGEKPDLGAEAAPVEDAYAG